MEIIDLDGKEVEVGTECLAEKELEEGKILVYFQTKRDIEHLIAHMTKAGEKDPELLDFDYWAVKKECAKMAASKCKKGDCSGTKTCKSVTSTSGFSYCRCKN